MKETECKEQNGPKTRGLISNTYLREGFACTIGLC